MHSTHNKPAPPNAGIAARLAIEHHWPGVGEPERSVSGRARWLTEVYMSYFASGLVYLAAAITLVAIQV